jgi:hypothetical protein
MQVSFLFFWRQANTKFANWPINLYQTIVSVYSKMLSSYLPTSLHHHGKGLENAQIYYAKYFYQNYGIDHQ